MMPAKFSTPPSRRDSVKILFALAAGPCWHCPRTAESAIDDCARARDPERCAARQARAQGLREKRGLERRACLDASMPPVDCSKASTRRNAKPRRRPRKSARARPTRHSKKCLRDEKPKKPAKNKKRRPSKATAGN
jgi:hypothetical protein